MRKPLVISWLEDLCILSGFCWIKLVFVQFVSHLSAAVQRMEINTVAGLVEFTAAPSSSPFPIHSFIFHFRRFLVQFFSLRFSFQVLLVPSLLLQIFMHCHPQAKVQADTKNWTMQLCRQMWCSIQTWWLILPSGLLFLHFFPAALHEFKCIVTLIFIPEGIKRE